MARASTAGLVVSPAQPRVRTGSLTRRRSIIAFLFCLPLIILITALVIYPFFFSLHLATLNKGMTKFVGLDNFAFLFKRETFWMVVRQSVIFAVSAVILKAIIGLIVAHVVHALPLKGQRKWRGMLLVPWVIPPAMSTLGWWWMFEPSYSALNYMLAAIGGGPSRGSAIPIGRVSP